MIYGGDEVSALVLDVGTSSTRLGYAGEDTPRVVIPTSYGYINRPDTTQATTEGVEPPIVRDLYVGEEGVQRWRAGMEVENPIVDGMIYDFNTITPILKHAFSKSLAEDPTEHPILVTEPAWNTPANRERMAEIMFEEFKVPAFYICNNAVLSAFSSGRGTALIVDIGKATASVIPVVDGFVLRKGIAHSSLPTLVRSAAHSLLSRASEVRPPVDLLPYQLIDKKTTVDLNQPPLCALREDRMRQSTNSWRTWAAQKEVEEWMMACCGVLPKGWSDDHARSFPWKLYEFPTGFNSSFGGERFIPGDIYFNHAHLGPPPPGGQLHAPTIPQLLHQAIAASEPDLRPGLLHNVVLTGGSSLMPGMADRLAFELAKLSGGQKVRLHSPGNAIERRYGAWLGGSILASLGTFHQLWISKQEWEEHGKSIVATRCK